MQTIESTKQCLIDTLGCILGGSTTPPAAHLVRSAEEWAASGAATLFGREPFTRAPVSAAFVNAGLANALDFDDTLIGHHGATVVTAALAVGEAIHATGRQLIEAVVVGYDVSIRCMGCLSPGFGRFTGGWDLGTLQTLGAAAAAAKLLGASQQQVSAALGLAMSTAPCPMPRKERAVAGPRSAFKSGYSWSVQAGIQAAILATQGYRAVDGCLDGELGYWTPSACDRLGLETLISRLGSPYLIQSVAQKAYPACRFTHTSLEAVEQIIARSAASPNHIEKISIRTFELLTDAHHNIRQPATYTEGQFSLPFVVAVLLVRGRLTAREMVNDLTRDEDVLRMACRIHVEEDPKATESFPEHETSTVTLRFNDGQDESQRIDVPLGSNDRRLSRRFLQEKFLHQATLAIESETELRRVLNLICEIEMCDDIRQIASLLTPNKQGGDC